MLPGCSDTSAFATHASTGTMPTGHNQQPSQSFERDEPALDGLALPGKQAAPEHRHFAVSSPSNQAEDLLSWDSLLDLPLYDPTAPGLAESESTPSHTDDFQAPRTPTLPEPANPTGSYVARSPTHRLTVGQPAPVQQASTLPVQWAHHRTADSSFRASSHTVLASFMLGSNNYQDTAVDPRPDQPSSAPPQHGLQTVIQALLDEPFTATLINAQVGRRRSHRTRPNHIPEHTSTAIAPRTIPITKPKRKKRPSDTINTLQQHIDSITDHIQHLTLRNDRLQRKKRVLGIFMQELSDVEAVADAIGAGIEQHKADPSTPLHGPAAFQSWTTQQFGEAYRGFVTFAGEWITKAEACAGAGSSPSAADVKQLDGAVQEFLHMATWSLFGRVEFMGRMLVQQQQLFTSNVPEEEHWQNVLAAMDLTEEQVEDLLVAREVYLQYSENAQRENNSATVGLQQRMQQAGAAGGALDSSLDADQIFKVATFVRKIHTLQLVLAMVWFKHILSPVQAAMGLLRAYPLVPGGRMLGNALYALHGQALGEPLLGPQPGPMATARTTAALLRTAGNITPHSSAPATGPHVSQMDSSAEAAHLSGRQR